MKNRYKLIEKENLIELLANLTDQYARLDTKTGNFQVVKTLKAEIMAIQKEILSRGQVDNNVNERERPGPVSNP